MLAADVVVHGRYRIVGPIGRGGMGAVYEAIDQRLGNRVALKQTIAEGPQAERAFEREAQLLAGLRYPALPVVSDFFADEHGQFLVMQFIPGRNLSELLKERGKPFSLREVLDWGDQVLRALEYLHRQEPPVVHRDIKPANVKLTGEGEIVLLDFGLAKGATSKDTTTTAASVYGFTPQYAPLEQMQGLGTGPAGDIYSLGATLHHLATNVAPADALTRAGAIAQGKPDPLRPAHELNPELSPAVSESLATAVALGLEQRFPSAAAMRASLKEAGTATLRPPPTVFESNRETVASPTALTATAPPPATSRSRLWRPVAAVTLAAVALFVAWLATTRIPASVGTVSTNGSAVSGRLVRWLIPKRVYTFRATPGQLVYFRLLKKSEGVNEAKWRLDDEDGKNVFDRPVYLDNPGVQTLARGGTYTLTVASGEKPATGTYAIQLYDVPVARPIPIALGSPIGDGQPEAGAGQIPAPGAKNVYRFSATAGQQVYFRLLKQPDGWLFMGWRLNDENEDGKPVFDAFFHAGDVGVKTLERGGTYTLTVGSDKDPATGKYAIQLYEVPAARPIPIALGSRISDGVPEPGAGQIPVPGAKNVYTFSVSPGQQVYFRLLKQPDDWLFMGWRLQDENEDGKAVFDAYFHAGDVGVKTLERGGTYTLTVGTDKNPATGKYALQLHEVPPVRPIPLTLPGGGGDGVRVAGQIPTPGARNVYTFSASPGRQVEFRLLKQADDMGFMGWRLVDENKDAKPVFDAYFYSGDPGVKTLERGGTYTLTVGSDNKPATGSYTIQITAKN